MTQPARSSNQLVAWACYLVAASLWLSCNVTRAQDAWDVSPYRIRAWLASDDGSGISGQALTQIAAATQQRAQAVVGAPWRLDAVVVSMRNRFELLHRLEPPTANALFSQHAELWDYDKLVLIVIRQTANGLQVEVQQLDCRTQSWGQIVVQPVRSASVLADRIVQAMVVGFSPLATIEEVVDGRLKVRLRAGRLVTVEDSPILVTAGALLQPISRYNDRSGKPIQGGIRPMPWTILEVADRQGAVALCDIHSGYARPFGGKRSRRIERLALLVRPTRDQTVLRLSSREDQSPLGGYSIYEKLAEKTMLLGETDWRGELAIARSQSPLRTLYVRSGKRTLAKLPLVPGVATQLVAQMVDDRQRAEVEGFLIGVQDELVDLVVRREVLASQIEKAVKDENIEVASQALEQLKTLDTKTDVTRRVAQFRQQQGILDRTTQAQVDKLFFETDKLLGDHLNQNRLIELERLVAGARRQSSSD